MRKKGEWAVIVSCNDEGQKRFCRTLRTMNKQRENTPHTIHDVLCAMKNGMSVFVGDSHTALCAAIRKKLRSLQVLS